MENLLGPFGDEAIATLIGAILGVVISLVIHYFQRRRPLHILCQELIRTSLIEIPREVVGTASLRFGDVPVSQLTLSKLRLRNGGDQTITKPTLTIKVFPDVRILALYPTFESGHTHYNIKSSPDDSAFVETTVIDNLATVTIDYLNPYKAHN